MKNIFFLRMLTRRISQTLRAKRDKRQHKKFNDQRRQNDLVDLTISVGDLNESTFDSSKCGKLVGNKRRVSQTCTVWLEDKAGIYFVRLPLSSGPPLMHGQNFTTK